MLVMKKFTSILLALLLVLAAPLGIFAGTDLPDMSGAVAPVADAATPVYGDVKIETDWVIDRYNTIAVKVYFVEAIDLKMWDMRLTYDADIFDFADKAIGMDAKQIRENCVVMSNSFTDESNPSVDGEINVGGYFKEVLWSAEDFLAASLPGKECIVNDEKFEAVVFYLKVEDKAAFDAHATTISIEGSMIFVERKSVADSITKSATILYGDVDGDGYLSAEDARRTLRAAVGLEALTEVQEYAADTDRSGRITAGDSRITLRAVLGLEYIDNIAPHIPILAPSDDPSAPWVTIETDWVMNYDQTIAVKVYFENAIGLNSWDLLLTYDADIFDFDEKALGADAKQVWDYCISDYNTFDDYYNDFTDGENRVSGYFKENLWTAEEFLANSNRDGDCIVNDEKFEAAVFYLEVEDPVAFNSEEITIHVKGNLRSGDTIVGTADIIEKTGCPHSERYYKTIQESTCTEGGIGEEICANCNETITIFLSTDPDNHTGETKIITIEPTDRLPGARERWCLDCGQMINAAEPIPPLDCIGYGMCGDNLHWVLKTDGTLYIFGTGEMGKGGSESDSWGRYSDSIKKAIIEEGATNIGGRAFYNHEALTEIQIPDSVTSIGDYAFEYCTSLASITFGENSQLTSIGNLAFASCTGLASITIPDSVTSIADWAFPDCTSLANITVDANNAIYSSDENGVLFNKDKTTLIQYPIGNTRTSYTIPDSVTSIGAYAFAFCTSLASITFGENSQLKSIGGYAFRDCASLASITIPDSVTSIGWSAFEYCTSLASVNFDENSQLTSIVAGVFTNCASLANITIPYSVENIGQHAFLGCSALTGIDILNPDCEIYDSADTIPQTTIIRGYLASGAQAYAEKYDRIFEPIDSHILMGDIDNDGQITAGDARLALRASVGLEMLTTRQKHIGDIDKDNIITAGDARLILRWSVGMLEDR